jgi:hypothetical protein
MSTVFKVGVEFHLGYLFGFVAEETAGSAYGRLQSTRY